MIYHTTAIKRKHKWLYYHPKAKYSGQRGILYKKESNTPRRYRNPESVCSKQHSCKICEAKKIMELKGDTEKLTITVEDFDTSHSISDRTIQIISKDTEELNTNTNQQVEINI